MSSKKNAVIVVGDGWAAMGAVGFLVHAGENVRWLSGSGARLLAPLPTIEVGHDYLAAETLRQLASIYGIDLGELQTGSYLREFRNKAFREPSWTKAPTPEDRKEVRNELLWEAERIMAPVFEGRYGLTLAEIDDQIRTRLLSGEFKNLKREEGVPITAIHVEKGKLARVTLGSGEELGCDRLIFADRWNTISAIEGMPKGLSFVRKREPTGVLQATFGHEVPMGVGLMEGFYGVLHKEAGEDVERHVWGYFSSDGARSFWTLCMAPDEVEDNHLIAKKLRRMKNALDKMFSGESWLPEGKTEFLSNVKDEQVRFEEAILYTQGEPVAEAIRPERPEGLCFLTDGYGPSMAINQVGRLFDVQVAAASTLDAEGADAQTENVDLNPPTNA